MALVPSLAGRIVLVTGATGFIGSQVFRELCESGAEVHGVSRTPRSDARSSRWWRCDLQDLGNVRELLKAIRPDLIIHLSGHVSAARSVDLILPTLHNDLLATVNVLTAATNLEFRRMVLTGSLEEPVPSEMEPVPSSPYAAAKWASGAYARMFHHLYRAPVVVVRPFMTYGPGDARRHKLIPYVIGSLLRDESPKLASGERRVDWIYIDDVVAGVLAAAHAPDVDGCTIDLGSGTLVPVREVVERLVELIGASVKPLFGVLPDRPLETVRAADPAIARAKLNWKPTISLKEGLARTVAWHRQQLASSGPPPVSTADAEHR